MGEQRAEESEGKDDANSALHGAPPLQSLHSLPMCSRPSRMGRMPGCMRPHLTSAPALHGRRSCLASVPSDRRPAGAKRRKARQVK